METTSNGASLQVPERLDTRFGVVAGLYAAALLSPPLVLVVVQRLQLRSEPLALGLLAVVGTCLTAVVTWRVTRWGWLLTWVQSPWSRAFVSAVGAIPMVAYLVLVIKYLAFVVTDLRPETATSLIGFVGFILGAVSLCLGGLLVHMASNRLVAATVDDSDIRIEWIAGWPRRARFKLVLGSLALVIPLFGLVRWLPVWWLPNLAVGVGGILTLTVHGVVSKQTYRLHPAGLETRREGALFGSRQFTPWAQFDGVTVTDDAIRLHRPFPRFDIRCARRDLDRHEADIVSSLDAHLDPRNS